MKIKCEFCGKELKKLNFSSNARVCGIAYVDENNRFITDVEEELELYDFEFFCPFCYEKLDISYGDAAFSDILSPSKTLRRGD